MDMVQVVVPELQGLLYMPTLWLTARVQVERLPELEQLLTVPARPLQDAAEAEAREQLY
jgi:hypothetical protein